MYSSKYLFMTLVCDLSQRKYARSENIQKKRKHNAYNQVS